MSERPDGALLRSWAHRGLEALGEARAEIDALNVFPVPDGDTGTNLYLTQEAACAAMEAALARAPEQAADVELVGEALASGALLGARGNSGIILSQLLRGFVQAIADPTLPAARSVAHALRVAATSAYEAVAVPVEGTVLTVARIAAEQGELVAEHSPDDVVAVVRAAARAAREALERTPQQLAALAHAGVVDSGGRGLVVLYDALEDVLTGVPRPYRAGPVPVPRPSPPEDLPAGGAYEVMYLLECDQSAAPSVRSSLALLGDSVVVVGSGALWNVHVHTDDVGAAIEAGIEAGRPYRIRVTALHSPQDHRTVEARSVVVVTHGRGIADLLGKSGLTTVAALPRQAPSTGELLAGIRAAGAREVVVLTSDSDTRPAAEAAARAARDEGLRVAVIPTRSIVQSLAASAVHDPGNGFDDDVIAMTRAAHATRYCAVTRAVREAMTMAGTCRPGDILGVIDGDIAVIGADVAQVAQQTLGRVLQGGGEVVTLVTGQDCPEGLVDGLRRVLRRDYPGVELTVHDGGQPLWPLIVGVE